MTRPALLIAVSMAILALVPASRADDDERSSHLIEFEIKDQFKDKHRHTDFENLVVVVVGSDRGGSEFNSVWGEAIHEALEHEPGYEEVEFLPVADVRGVPFFMKGFVRRKFPKDPERWCLTDWKGKFPKAYGFVKDSSNILVFDRSGALVHQASGRDLETATLEGIVDAIRPLLAPGLDP